MEREDFRTILERARFELRKRAIQLLKSGKKQYEVAQIIGTKKGTISKWNSLYKAKGVSGLKAHKNGVKSEDKKLLSTAEENSI